MRKFRKSPKKYRYDGIAWRASTVNVPGSAPVYRFSDAARGDWFYTTSASVKVFSKMPPAVPVT